MNADIIGAIIGIGIIVAFLIPALIRQRREFRELDQQIRCGPGCICAGENVRQYARQQLVIQAPQQVIYLEAPSPIVLQASQPDVRYLPARGETTPIVSRYRPEPYQAPRRVESYYAEPEPYYPDQDLMDYARSVPRYLPRQQPVAYLPPASADQVEAARRVATRRGKRK